MGMAGDHLVADGPGHVFYIEGAGLFGHARMKDDLKQEIAKLFAKRREVALLDGVGHLVGLFDGVGRDGREGLLDVPWATPGGVAQPGHDCDKPFEGVSRIGDRVGLGSGIVGLLHDGLGDEEGRGERSISRRPSSSPSPSCSSPTIPDPRPTRSPIRLTPSNGLSQSWPGCATPPGVAHGTSSKPSRPSRPTPSKRPTRWPTPSSKATSRRFAKSLAISCFRSSFIRAWPKRPAPSM